MEIPFWKMHGAANDFILVDDRELSFPAGDTEWMARVCARHTGVGCEGLILIQPSDTADFRMRFFNPDGNEVEMCGNGARCVARLSHELGIAPDCMAFDTVAGRIRAEILEEGLVRIWLTPPKDWRIDANMQILGREMNYHAVNTGVPHVVTFVEDLDDVPVTELGAGIRYHEDFQPAGTNANFVQLAGPSLLRIRTYERGVEAETPACGTGITAAGLIAGRLGHVTPPVHITCASGDTLVVNFDATQDEILKVSLAGPAEHVFRGTIKHPTI